MKTIYDVCFDPNASEGGGAAGGQWVDWMATTPALVIPKEAAYENIVIPTLDSIRMTYVFKTLLLKGKHILCAGPTGTGKTVNISEFLYKNAPDHYETIALTFSAQTHVNQVQVRF